MMGTREREAIECLHLIQINEWLTSDLGGVHLSTTAPEPLLFTLQRTTNPVKQIKMPHYY